MAKDDYDVVVYRMLVYLYAVLKHKIIFEDATFRQAVRKNIESDEYFTSILRMMKEENLIEGLSFERAWGVTTFLYQILLLQRAENRIG